MAIIVTGQSELQALILDLAKWSSRKTVLRTFETGMKPMGKTMAADVRTRVLATPSKRSVSRRGRRSLRASIARATKSNTQQIGDAAILTVQVDPEDMPIEQGGLPALYEGLEAWIHPVFGHRPMVTQPPHPYFEPATRNAERDAVEIAEHCIDIIADDLEG